MNTSFALNPDPTFKANVHIPRAGKEDGIVTFTFKHFPMDELSELEKKDLPGKDFLKEIITAWALPDEYSEENLSVLLKNYPAALRAIIGTFYSEIMGAREKN
jgi:hypothetical protein